MVALAALRWAFFFSGFEMFLALSTAECRLSRTVLLPPHAAGRFSRSRLKFPPFRPSQFPPPSTTFLMHLSLNAFTVGFCSSSSCSFFGPDR